MFFCEHKREQNIKCAGIFLTEIHSDSGETISNTRESIFNINICFVQQKHTYFNNQKGKKAKLFYEIRIVQIREIFPNIFAKLFNFDLVFFLLFYLCSNNDGWNKINAFDWKPKAPNQKSNKIDFSLNKRREK